MEEPPENEDEILLPPLPVKPQKNLFSYFNVGRSTPSVQGNAKSSQGQVKQLNVEITKSKKSSKDNLNKSTSSGISISLFGQSASKRIKKTSGKKLSKVNTRLNFEVIEKFTQGNSEDGENNSDKDEGLQDLSVEDERDENDENDVFEDENNITKGHLTEDEDQASVNDLSEESRSENSQNEGVEEIPDEKPARTIVSKKKKKLKQDESQNEILDEKNYTTKCKKKIKKLNQYFSSASEMTDEKGVVTNSQSKTNSRNNDLPSESHSQTSQDERTDERCPAGNNNNKLRQSFDSRSESESSQNEGADENLPKKVVRKKKKSGENVQCKSEMQSSQDEIVDEKMNTTNARRKKMNRRESVDSGSECQSSQDKIEDETLPRRVLRKGKKLRCYFDSSEEELDKSDLDGNIAHGNKNEVVEESDCSELSVVISPIKTSSTDTMHSRTHIASQNEHVESSDLLSTERKEETHGLTESERNEISSVHEDEHLPFIGTIYPTSLSSKYKSLLQLEIMTGTSSVAPAPDDLHTRTVGHCLSLLQSEYPDIRVKKIFQQFINCQKLSITKNLTKLEASKKVLENLWKRDTELKSEEIALAEEMRLKNEELAAAEQRKKERNDIREIFKRKKVKRRKKVDEDVIVPENSETQNSEKENIENSKDELTETGKKTLKKDKRKLKKQGIRNYLQNNDNCNKRNEKQAASKGEKKKGETNQKTNSQSEPIDVPVEITEGNMKPSKRKLPSSNTSSSKKKVKMSMSTEEPIERRRSARHQIPIELDSTKSDTCDKSDDVEKFTALKEGSGLHAGSDKHIENNEDISNSTKKQNETSALRRSSRVRKKIIEDIPIDDEIDGEVPGDDETTDNNGILTPEINELKEEVETKEENTEFSDDDIQILNELSTPTKAMKTWQSLESPRKSPRKPVAEVLLDENFINSCLSWNEKYQPNKARHVISDKLNMKQLFNWLTSWKEHHESAIRKMLVRSSKSSKQDGSGSESESEESDFEDHLCNTMVLSGPCGSGTTTAVYACASQLDFKVLELNPSIYRTGKQIFDQVYEAVVSHQVNKVGGNNEKQTNDVKPPDFFSAKTLKHTNKREENFVSSKKVKNTGRKEELIKKADSSEEVLCSSTSVDAMSLILFEQADIVYEDLDRGFYQGIADLRQLAKRPMILTANNPNTLENIFDEGAWIENISLTYPKAEQLLPFLQLMCLAEQVFVPKQLLINIIDICKNDVRKIILHLMFWCDQGKQPLFKVWKAKDKTQEISKDDDTSVLDISDIIVDNDVLDIEIDTSVAQQHNSTNVFITEMSPNALPIYKDEIFLNRDKILKEHICACNNIHSYHSFTKSIVKNELSDIDCIAASIDAISEMNSRLTIDQNDFEGDRYKWTATFSDSLSDTFIEENDKADLYPTHIMCKDVKEAYKEYYQHMISNNCEQQVHSSGKQNNISFTDLYDSALHGLSAKYHITRKHFLLNVLPYMKKMCQLEELKLCNLHSRKRSNRRYMHYLHTNSIHLDEVVLQQLAKSLL